MHLKSLIFKNKKSLLFVSILFILFSFFYIQNIYNEYQITKIIQNANKNAILPHEKYRKRFIYFTFGTGEKITFPLYVSMAGDYKVNLLMEVIGSDKLIEEYFKLNDTRAFYLIANEEQSILGKNDTYPFSFEVKGYKLEGKNRILFYENKFSYKTIKQAATLATPSNKDNRAYRNRYNLTRLSRGNYEFEITDTSPKTENFNNLNTYISILKQDIYY